MSLKSSRRAARGGARVVPLKLESNIQGVIDRMKRRPRDIRAALAATLSAPAWEAQMQAEARKTIWALASQPEWGFVDSFVSAVLVRSDTLDVEISYQPATGTVFMVGAFRNMSLSGAFAPRPPLPPFGWNR